LLLELAAVLVVWPMIGNGTFARPAFLGTRTGRVGDKIGRFPAIPQNTGLSVPAFRFFGLIFMRMFHASAR